MYLRVFCHRVCYLSGFATVSPPVFETSVPSPSVQPVLVESLLYSRLLRGVTALPRNAWVIVSPNINTRPHIAPSIIETKPKWGVFSIILLWSFDMASGNEQREGSLPTTLSSVITMVIQSPAMVFAFERISSKMSNLSSSSHPTPVSSDRTKAQITVYRDPRSIDGEIQSVAITSKRELHTSLASIRVPLLPLITGDTVHFPTDFTTYSYEGIYVSITVLLCRVKWPAGAVS